MSVVVFIFGSTNKMIIYSVFYIQPVVVWDFWTINKIPTSFNTNKLDPHGFWGEFHGTCGTPPSLEIQMTQAEDLNSAPMTDPWELVYLPTWMVDFYGIHVGEYTSSHGSYGACVNFWVMVFFRDFVVIFTPIPEWNHQLAWVKSPDTNIMWIMSLCIRDLCIAVNPPFPPRIGWLLSSWKRSGYGLFGSLMVLGATNLVGGFKYVLCSPLFGEMIQFD